MEKVCVNHPESPAVGSCKACEKPVCLMCITEVQGVSFCSDACGAAYQEVKDWLERPAAEEEWNPLAEAKAKAAPAAKAPPEPEPAPEPAVDGTGPQMQEALNSTLDEPASPAWTAPASSPGRNRMPLYIAVAATGLVVIGAFFLFAGGSSEPEIAKVDPPKIVDPPKPMVKVDPPKPEPAKIDPPKPVVKVDPPKPEPAKVDPPKPEPAKVDPPKPVVKVDPPKPEPAKVDPPKPVVKVDPPKPEPAKVDPPKPEPPPSPHLAFIRDPWAKEKTGAWYRVKSTSGGKDSYKDVGLRESGAGYRVLVSQTSTEGKTEAEQFTWTEPEEVATFGSVNNGDAKGTKYTADVVRTKAAKQSQYVIKDGPSAGVYFASDAVLSRLDHTTLKIKDREVACTVMETEPKDGKKGSTTWFS
ncbi:MAG TPA: hypothetical protein VG457_06210, partial [Planctomycetota bacterium]|nr:hypothetical protein [Planctomycetota bacterium]